MPSADQAPAKRRYLVPAALLFVFIAGVMLGGWFAGFEAQDDCLDRGGRWGAGVCEGVPLSE